MSDKTECKNKVARLHYYSTWAELCKNGNHDGTPDEWIDEAMEEYRQSSPVESPDEFAMKFLEYASGLAVSNYKSGGHWYLSDGRIVKTADILKQFKSELEEPKEK